MRLLVHPETAAPGTMTSLSLASYNIDMDIDIDIDRKLHRRSCSRGWGRRRKPHFWAFEIVTVSQQPKCRQSWLRNSAQNWRKEGRNFGRTTHSHSSFPLPLSHIFHLTYAYIYLNQYIIISMTISNVDLRCLLRIQIFKPRVVILGHWFEFAGGDATNISWNGNLGTALI